MHIRKTVDDFFLRKLWAADKSSLVGYKAFIIKFLRLVYATGREIAEAQLTLRAMSLVYTTLLSLVPLLAVSFSVLKAFGVHSKVEPFLSSFLAPLGPRGAEITSRIIEFVSNMKVGVLGFLGLALLVYTIIALLQKIELAFNTIWRVESARSFSRRFSDYMSVILIGPVLVFAAMGLTASFMSTAFMQKLISIEPFGFLISFSVKLLPYVLVCATFTFIYVFVPNTKVNLKAAIAGGITGGILWETAGWSFASFIVTSTKYAAIYSGFAILILFMIWLYLSWLILLIGVVVSYYYQYPQLLVVKKDRGIIHHQLMERVAFLVMFLVGYNFYHDSEHWTLDALVKRIGVSVDPIRHTIKELIRAGLIIQIDEGVHEYLPARALETIRLGDIIASMRQTDEEVSRQEGIFRTAEIDGLLTGIDTAIMDSLGDRTLKDVVVAHERGRRLKIRTAS
jgi:membrane protein